MELFNHLVCECEQVRRHVQPERLRSLQIEREVNGDVTFLPTAICCSPAQHHRKLVGLALYPIIRQMERAGGLVHDDSHPTVAEDLVIPLGRQIEAPADIQNR
jgi:hypothetical protein